MRPPLRDFLLTSVLRFQRVERSVEVAIAPSRLNPHRFLCEIRLFFACALSLDAILSPAGFQAERGILRAMSHVPSSARGPFSR